MHHTILRKNEMWLEGDSGARADPKSESRLHVSETKVFFAPNIIPILFIIFVEWPLVDIFRTIEIFLLHFESISWTDQGSWNWKRTI